MDQFFDDANKGRLGSQRVIVVQAERLQSPSLSNLKNIPKMQEETVEFKMDVSDEKIKREAMKIVWMFSGVTFVDIKEKGTLKVKGKFDQMELGRNLQEIYSSVDIINPTRKAGQNHIPGLSTVYNYLTTPKMQEILVFKFKVLNERIIRDAMEVIWEFPGVTSVEVKGDADQLEVNGGEFSKIVMAAKLKDIDESVSFIIKAGPDVEAPNNATSYGTNSKIKDALSVFRAPKPAPPPPPEPTHARGRGKSFNHDRLIIPQQPILNAVAAGVRNFMYKPDPNQRAEINWGKKPQPEVKHQEQGGGLFGYFGKKQQPQKEKPVREIPKPQSTASASKKEGETQSLTSSLITGLGTMNPFQSKTQNSQMMSSQSSGSTRIQYATRKGT